MRVLFLAPRFPWPLDTGGKIRTFNLLKQLAKESEVHLVCFSMEATDQAQRSQVEDLGIKVTLLPMVAPKTLAKAYTVLFQQLPYSILKYDHLDMHQAILDVMQEHQFDVMHIDHVHMAHYKYCAGNVRCVLDEHNVEYRILDRCATVEPFWLKKMLYRQQAIKMRSFEAYVAKQFHRIFACSAQDRILLSKLTSGLVPVDVVPNGVDTRYFDPPSKPDPLEDALVFTGSMDWLPNEDAINYFCRDILPLIWEKKPDLKLYVVGKDPSLQVQSLAEQNPRVLVTGRIDDVRPYLTRSKIFIVPLRIGGGTRLKILEAMAMRKAIVSTTIGAEGIGYTDGKNIRLADTPQDFANAVIKLLGDPDLALSMGSAGRSLVDQEYEWDKVGAGLNNIYREMLHEAK